MCSHPCEAVHEFKASWLVSSALTGLLVLSTVALVALPLLYRFVVILTFFIVNSLVLRHFIQDRLEVIPGKHVLAIHFYASLYFSFLMCLFSLSVDGVFLSEELSIWLAMALTGSWCLYATGYVWLRDALQSSLGIADFDCDEWYKKRW